MPRRKNTTLLLLDLDNTLINTTRIVPSSGAEHALRCAASLASGAHYAWCVQRPPFKHGSGKQTWQRKPSIRSTSKFTWSQPSAVIFE